MLSSTITGDVLPKHIDRVRPTRNAASVTTKLNRKRAVAPGYGSPLCLYLSRPDDTKKEPTDVGCEHGDATASCCCCRPAPSLLATNSPLCCVHHHHRPEADSGPLSCNASWNAGFSVTVCFKAKLESSRDKAFRSCRLCARRTAHHLAHSDIWILK